MNLVESLLAEASACDIGAGKGIDGMRILGSKLLMAVDRIRELEALLERSRAANVYDGNAHRRVSELEAALAKYGQHTEACLMKAVLREGRGHKYFTCQCGFADFESPQTETFAEPARSIPEGGNWHPIESAPRDVVALFWIRPGTVADGEYFVTTSGEPIISDAPPRIHMGKYATWSSLSIATHWAPLPAPPALNR